LSLTDLLDQSTSLFAQVEKLQHDLHKQQQVLGVYRHQSHKAKEVSLEPGGTSGTVDVEKLLRFHPKAWQ